MDGQPFECRVSRVRTQDDDGNRMTLVELGFASELERELWRYDEVVELRMPVSFSPAGIPVPLTALRKRATQWSVFVLKSFGDVDRLQEIPVRVQRVAADAAFVEGKLQPGDNVVSDGLHRVVAGQRVFIRGDNAPLSQGGAAQ